MQLKDNVELTKMAILSMALPPQYVLCSVKIESPAEDVKGVTIEIEYMPGNAGHRKMKTLWIEDEDSFRISKIRLFISSLMYELMVSDFNDVNDEAEFGYGSNGENAPELLKIKQAIQMAGRTKALRSNRF